MRTGGKTALTVRGACVLAGLTFCLASVEADDHIRVVIEGEAVTIITMDAGLRDVLEELSRRANLSVLSEEPLDEVVTVDISLSSLPEAIRRLLRQKSYMLHLLSNESVFGAPGSSTYGRLWIFSDEEQEIRYAWMSRPSMQPYTEPGDEMIDYRAMAYSNDARVREEAMYGLADIGDGQPVGYLEQALSDPDDGVREAAIDALMKIGTREPVEALGFVLSDANSRLRVNAVDALGAIGGEAAMKHLQDAMADEDPVVREAAADWLTELAWRDD